ncbi:MAG: hypothetical protein FJ405_14390 [Verrucomicrobia bacterium]|nr:hypothetical protein [Verrucomicrobiota bacterium]
MTNCVDFGFRLRRSQIRYFEVNVPMEARQAVVQVVSGSPGHSFIFGFNSKQLPDLDTDVFTAPLLLNVGPAGPTSVPPGSKFFLAVQTDFSPDPHDLVIRVDFELPMTRLINGVPFVPAFGVNQAGVNNFFQMTPALLNQTNILYPGTNIHWYKYTVAPSPTLHSVVFRLHSTNSELQMVARRSLPEVAYLPTPTLFDYHSINYDLTNDVIIVTSNSFPVPITAIPWVIGVYNAGTNSAAYHLTGTRWTNRPPVAIPLPAFTINTNWINITNEVGFSIDPGESLNTFYRFQSDSTNRTVLFELLSLTGDADLRVRRNDLPSPSLFDLSDFQIGTNSEHVAVNTNVFLPTFGAPTNWYLNVLNASSTTVTGILRVATASGTNIIVSGLPLELEPVGISASDGLIITWRSIPGQVYEVRTSSNALGPFNTLAATVLATSSISQWTDPNPPIPPQTRFYKVFQIGPP